MKSEILFMRRAAEIAGESQCWIGMGCVIAKGGKVLAEAWNETLEGEEYCVDYRTRIKKQNSKGLTFSNEKVRPLHTNEGCIRHELRLSQGREIEKVCSVHAEANAIARAARQGIKIEDATMFITSFPCLICMRSIIISGIKKLVYMNDFYKPHHEELFKNNGVKIEQITEDKVWEGI